MLARLVARALADAAVSSGIRDRTDEMVDELEPLLAEPLGWFLEHPHWPSALTSEGMPVEVSLSSAEDGTPSIRCAVDVTDHRRGIGGNWRRYLDCAQRVTEAGAPELWRLLETHLNGCSPSVQLPMEHGVGYGRAGARRATLYFAARELSAADLGPDTGRHLATLDRGGELFRTPIHCISYDFAAGRIVRTKFYRWVSSDDPTGRLSKLLRDQPDLEAAANVVEHFAAGRGLPALDPSLVLQSSVDAGREDCRHKLMFMSEAWGWDQANGFRDLIAHLSRTFSLDLAELYTFLGVFSAHGISLRPSWLAIGSGTPSPTLTCYFAPAFEHVGGPAAASRRPPGSSRPAPTRAPVSRAGLVDEMLTRATEYVLGAREADGHWVDFAQPQGTSDEWVTAYVAAMLSNDPKLHAALEAPLRWLDGRYRPGEGWRQGGGAASDAETTALALLAMHRTGWPAPAGSAVVLERPHRARRRPDALVGSGPAAADDDASPEEAATVVLARMQAGPATTGVFTEAIADLVARQREDGGWSSHWWKDDLFATHRALLALAAFAALPSAGSENGRVSAAVRNAIGNAHFFLVARPIPDEPCALGLWLANWCAVRGNVDFPSVGRALQHLRGQQAADGRWLAVPMRRAERARLPHTWARADSGRLYLDPKCLVTTVMVMDGLMAVRRAV